MRRKTKSKNKLPRKHKTRTRSYKKKRYVKSKSKSKVKTKSYKKKRYVKTKKRTRKKMRGGLSTDDISSTWDNLKSSLISIIGAKAYNSITSVISSKYLIGGGLGAALLFGVLMFIISRQGKNERSIKNIVLSDIVSLAVKNNKINYENKIDEFESLYEKYCNKQICLGKEASKIANQISEQDYKKAKELKEDLNRLYKRFIRSLNTELNTIIGKYLSINTENNPIQANPEKLSKVQSIYQKTIHDLIELKLRTMISVNTVKLIFASISIHLPYDKYVKDKDEYKIKFQDANNALITLINQLNSLPKANKIDDVTLKHEPLKSLIAS